MAFITARIVVAPDGTISGLAPEGLPPGEHDVMVSLPASAEGKPFKMENWPVQDMGWDDASVSLRREDMYGDDGR